MGKCQWVRIVMDLGSRNYKMPVRASDRTQYRNPNTLSTVSRDRIACFDVKIWQKICDQYGLEGYPGPTIAYQIRSLCASMSSPSIQSSAHMAKARGDNSTHIHRPILSCTLVLVRSDWQVYISYNNNLCFNWKSGSRDN